jgi:hypothetical protein
MRLFDAMLRWMECSLGHMALSYAPGDSHFIHLA